MIKNFGKNKVIYATKQTYDVIFFVFLTKKYIQFSIFFH